MNKIIIICALALIFCYKLLLTILEALSSKRPIPDNLTDIYSDIEYKKWQSYHYKRIKLDIFELVVKYIVLIVLFITNLYSLFASLFKDTMPLQILSIMILSFGVDTLFGIWFDYYKTMVLDKEYGLSVTKIGTFILDQIKDLVIGFGLTYSLVLLFGALHTWLGNWMILVFIIVLLIIVLVISLFLPMFMRIYYKCDDLEEGELREKLETLLDKHGYKVRKIGVINQSKRSTTGNALFTGMGKFKTIILFDTILNQLTTDEIVAVFAHELGHGKHKDTTKNYFITILSVTLLVFIAWLLINYEALFTDFGFNGINYAFAFIVLSEVVLEVVSPIKDLISNKISRKAEFEADNFACSSGYGEALATALKKLSNSNMANLNPHPVLVKIKYSHPTMSDRLTNIYKHTIKEEE